MLLFVLICADPLISDDRSLYFQNRLLEKFFLFLRDGQRDHFSGGMTIEDICQWNSRPGRFLVKCEPVNEIVTVLQFSKWDGSIGLFNIRYLPNSVRNFQVAHCSQKQEIITRTFPRMALRLALVGNMYYGTPDLATLPPRLERLYLNKNNLKGPVNLCSLPETLKCLNLRRNSIDEDYIFYKSLPKNLTGIYLGSNKHIGGIYAFPETEATTKKHLFHQIDEKKIH
uniref:Uncharacterized protein n=1 Tax=Paramoeba aestuarina TaxID=180227 RepID=A0A7S4NWH5_9EUKA|mmetsp:Transcript_29569/g.45705  ORF Transcript_29569/g.45705 Transcript_29569/m.45705 type:complete len:227 (+) Transcript_29569:28-708(+)